MGVRKSVLERIGPHVFKNFIFFSVMSFLALGCSKNPDHRQSTRDQVEADAAAQMADLKPAEGEYDGVVHLRKSHQNFRCHLSLKRVYENIRNPQGSDPTGTANIPKLSGVLSFPVLDALDERRRADYAELTDPLGQFAQALFDFGDYDPQTNLMVLPYNISGYSQGSFGEFTGELHAGVYKGTWFAKPLGEVANFELRQVSKETP